MDLSKSYSLLSAECMLLNQFYKFTNYSPGVLGDLAVAHATQEEFDHEQAFQKAIEAIVDHALNTAKKKIEECEAKLTEEQIRLHGSLIRSMQDYRDPMMQLIMANSAASNLATGAITVPTATSVFAANCLSFLDVTRYSIHNPQPEVKEEFTRLLVNEPIGIHPPPDSISDQVPAFSPLEMPATSLDTPQLQPNDSQLIKSSCASQVLEDPETSVNSLPPGSKLESAASLSQSEGPATSRDSSANFLPPDSKPESAAAPSFSERPASPLDKRQSSPKDPQHAVLSLLRRSASVPGRQHDSTRKKNKSTPSVKPIILKTQTEQKNPDETELPSEEAPEADDDKQPDLTSSLEEFRTQNSPTRKRLERVTPLRLDKESAKAENLIDQLLRVQLSIQVSNTNPSQQLINVFVLVTEVRSKNLQFVWDPGGKVTNRVSRLSLGPASETSLTPTTKRNDQQEDELTDSKTDPEPAE